MHIQLTTALNEQISNIQENIAQDPESARRLAYYLKEDSWDKAVSKENKLLIFSENSQVVGFLDANLGFSSPSFHFAYWVNPELRGQGYGKQILLTSMAWMKENTRTVHAVAEVEADNLSSIKVLEACNFKFDYKNGNHVYYTRVI